MMTDDCTHLHTPTKYCRQSMILPSVNRPFCVCLYKPKMTCTVTVCVLKTNSNKDKKRFPSIKCVCFQLLKTGLACSHVLSVLNSCSHVNTANSVLLKLQANPLHSRSDSCQHKYTHLLLCGGISSPPHFLWQREHTHTLQKNLVIPATEKYIVHVARKHTLHNACSMCLAELLACLRTSRRCWDITTSFYTTGSDTNQDDSKSWNCKSVGYEYWMFLQPRLLCLILIFIT